MDNNIIFDPMAWAAATDNNSKPASDDNDQIKGKAQHPNPAVPDVGNELEKAKAAVEELRFGLVATSLKATTTGGSVAVRLQNWGPRLAICFIWFPVRVPSTVSLTVRKNGRNAFRRRDGKNHLSQLFTKWNTRRLA